MDSRKKMILIGGVVLVVLLGGFFAYRAMQKPVANDQTGMAGQKDTATQKEEKSLFTKAAEVKDAILGGKKLQCKYKIEEGPGKGTESSYYVEGEKFRSSFTDKGETFNTVSDGKIMYSWSTKTKQGSKIDIACMEEAARVFSQGSENVDQAEYESPEEFVDNQTNIQCQTVDDIDFSIPNDVTFTDTCAQMKQSLEMMKKYDLDVNIPPAGVMPPGVEQE